LISEWYNDKSSQNEANVVTVAHGLTTANINADLVSLAALGTGCITGTVTSNGAPVAGAYVLVFEPGLDQPTYSPSRMIGGNGAYEICNIKPGPYQVSFSHFLLATTWYNGQNSRPMATMIQVTAGITTPNINGRLDQLGGCVSGKITDFTGQPAASASYQLLDTGGNPTFAYGGRYGSNFNMVHSPDEDGGFAACGLASGDYTIRCFGEYGRWGTVAAPGVLAGQEKSGLICRLGPLLHLPVILKN
jgi:hypothetical protein